MRYRPEYDKELIGKNLRRCRQEKGFSVEQVKEYLRIGSIQAIYKWEEGKSYPQTDTMFALMELYGIGLPDLLYKEREELWIESANACEIDMCIWKHMFEREHKKEGTVKRLIRYIRYLHKNIAYKNKAISE